MKRKTIRTAIEVAKRFIEVAKELERINIAEAKTNKYYEEMSCWGIKESAQLKRVSMDLTKILADLRLNR